MKFSDLDDFVNNQMNLQGEDKNFQQVVISTLIQNGGKATIEELKEQVFKEYADYSLNKLYNFNELLIDTIHQLQFKQMAVQELITHRLDNICPKEKTN